MPQHVKKRRYPRIGLPKGMEIAWQGGARRAVTRIGTLSLGGLFVQTEDPPNVGETIRVFFTVSAGEVRATAIVRDSAPGKGMGIEFASMDPLFRARLVQSISRLLGESAT
jgi:hypothetical protein